MCVLYICSPVRVCVSAAAKRTVACNSSSNNNNRMTATLFTRVFCSRTRVDGDVCALFHTQFVLCVLLQQQS